MTYKKALDHWERKDWVRNILRAVQCLSLITCVYLIGSFLPPNQGSISGEHQQYIYARSLLVKHHKALVGKTALGCLAVTTVSEALCQWLDSPEP